MIINKKVLAELLLAAGYGKLVSIGPGEVYRNKGVPSERTRGATADDLEDFNITVEVFPVVPKQAHESFSPAEVLEALKEKFDVASNVVILDMRLPNTHHGVTLETISHKQSEHAKLLQPCLDLDSVTSVPRGQIRDALEQYLGLKVVNIHKPIVGPKDDLLALDLDCKPKEGQLVLTPTMLAHFLGSRNLGCNLDFEYEGYQIQVTKKKERKPRQLKRLGQLKGLTIESVKTVQQGTKAYIKTTDGAGICLEQMVVVQTLHPDENIALGLLTKEDLASIAKAKKMGLI